MSAFVDLTLRPTRPEERIMRCAGLRRINPRSKNKGLVSCEKGALHGQGCLLTDAQIIQCQANRPAGVARGLARMFMMETARHAGRDRHGKWYFWDDDHGIRSS